MAWLWRPTHSSVHASVRVAATMRCRSRMRRLSSVPASASGFCRVWGMFAVTAVRIDADDPLSGLELGERPEPEGPDGWTTVTVKAAALNHHDVWTLRGVGISAERLPMVLGCDAAGIDAAGNEVLVHAVIADPDAGGGDETLDPRRSLLSERYDGAFA